MLVLHDLSELQIDTLIVELNSCAKEYGISRLFRLANNYHIYFTFTEVDNVVSVNVFPNDNSWIAYSESLQCNLNELKSHLLNTPYLELTMSTKNKPTITPCNNDLWDEEKAARQVQQYNDNETVPDNLKVIQQEQQIIEQARNSVNLVDDIIVG
jgi:hypothetical protein